jgi:asparagine synthase (glutamine-hydrolysing)
MCGICGFYYPIASGAIPSVEARRAALAALAHRGPDGTGDFVDGGAWLGHRRLSILDLTEAGAQPMLSNSGRFVVTFNGEIYNFREIASRLGLEGLRSRSDTEVLLRAYELMGIDMLKELNGVFALAIYDRTRNQMMLARDRLGVKPLYYSWSQGGLAFASEIKGILSLTGETVSANVAGIREWMYFGANLGGRTLVQGIQQLVPGGVLTLDLGHAAPRIEQFWTLASAARHLQSADKSDGRDLVVRTREVLEAAVRRQLVSDVPLGVFLSGGVDSSAITAFASRHYRGQLATYSVGFDDPSHADERPAARRVAELFDTDHHELTISRANAADLVERMVEIHDLPFADAANIPVFLMSEAVSRERKVVLQGDGGDELFGGYRRYVTLRWRRLLHLLSPIGTAAEFASRRSVLASRIARYSRAFGEKKVSRTMARLLSAEGGYGAIECILRPSFRAEVEREDPFERFIECQSSVAWADITNQMSFVDMLIVLPDIYLEKVDRASMANGLEVRVPLLDNEVVNLVLGETGEAKIPYGRKKWLLRQALRGVVPDAILDAPKRGFDVPFATWLGTSLRESFMDHLEWHTRQYPEVLEANAVRKMFRECVEYRGRHAPIMWKVLNFMIWSRQKNVRIHGGLG